MSMNVVIDALSWALLMSGAAVSLIGGIGMLRLPDVFTRMHAASLTDTGGIVLILGGLALQAGLSLVTAKLVFIILFLLITNPTATHALARAALHDGIKPQINHDKRRNTRHRAR